eukprot:Gregarina_sp_Pseudo_9__1881@NODE_228_length_3510_cov_10_685681_g212_i0_p2_GENE_NODE_228_length_3510_cov_10_685681_g212_i0NODE_228_length_3510_cov_10_685681_g212_i0_p2_ORF_typecomplete_len344_score9_45CRCB/PF02537_15/1_4e13CRCB/PF02537_15/1e16Baculo_p74/PF04583_12/0_1PLDc_N/PF13396_6/0_34PLDc_N/PF13396_6/5_5e03_NODE_228_length_3510_cov_10_685681_g212_i0481079
MTTKALECASVVLGSLLGCVARNAIVAFTPSSAGAPHFYYWLSKEWIANGTGCFIMGLIRQWQPKSLHFLQIGVAIGFCGSLTTWSSLVASLRLDIIAYGEKSSMWLLKMFINICVYFMLYLIGAHITHLIYHIDLLFAFWDEFNRNRHQERPINNTCSATDDLDITNLFDGRSALKTSNRYVKTCLWIVGSTAVAAYCSAIIVVSVIPDKTRTAVVWAISCLFAPFGALLRYALRKLNQKRDHWPSVFRLQYGTYTANLLGTVICLVLIRWSASLSPESVTNKIWMLAIQNGFAGCLSTTSSFIHEMHSLDQSTLGKTLALDFYVLITIATGFLLSFMLPYD